MSKQVFINLAVKDVIKSMNFYESIGFTNNVQFSDETGKCMQWSDHIFVMILSHEKFSSFINKPIADTQNAVAGLFALSLDSVEEVHETMNKGLQAGGKEPVEAKDYGFMIQRTLEDFDGHNWELFYMDMSKIPTQ